MSVRPASSAALALFLVAAACGDDDAPMAPGSSAAAVAACEAAGDAYARLCTSDGQRVCHVAAYRSYCASSSNPAAAAAALDCLRASSQADSCRTFSDPSGAAMCVGSALAPVTTPEQAQIVAALLQLCPTQAQTSPVLFEPPLPMMSATERAAVSTCIRGAATCAEAEACLNAGPQARIATCY